MREIGQPSRCIEGRRPINLTTPWNSIYDIPFNALHDHDHQTRQKFTALFQQFIRGARTYDVLDVSGLKHVKKWVIRNGQPWPRAVLEPGKYLYTLMPDGELRISNSPREAIAESHADIANGHPVIAAGQIIVEKKGIINAIDNKSGRYKPDAFCSLYAKAAFIFYGIQTCEQLEEKYVYG
jgi:hypothetical protein